MKRSGYLVVLFVLLGGIGYFTLQSQQASDLDNETQANEGVALKSHGKQTDPEPKIGITKADRKVSVDILNEVLANEFVLLLQTLNYHWNLVGPQFNDYHKLFNDQYTMIFGFTDTVAERIRVVGGIAIASMSELVKISSLKEDTGDIPEPTEMVKNLLKQHEALIVVLRQGIDATTKDMGTNNFLTDLIEKHEKMAWMLRSLTAH